MKILSKNFLNLVFWRSPDEQKLGDFPIEIINFVSLCRGAHIYNKLIDFIRSEYYKRGFQEVVSPNIYNSKLWQTSGHWEHYSDAMFKFESEKEMFGLKPMNCPGHCLIFDHGVRSWKVMNT